MSLKERWANRKKWPNLYAEGLEQGHAEMREVMECGHPKACVAGTGEYVLSTEAMIEGGEPSEREAFRCSACARERRIKELAEKWRDPEFWKDKGAAMDSHDCADELERVIRVR